MKRTRRKLAAFEVCPIIAHPFASTHMIRVLRKIPRVRIGSYEEKQSAGGPIRVFLIDLFGLKLPLETWMIRLEMREPGARVIVLGLDQGDSDVARLLMLGSKGFLRYQDVANKIEPALCAVAEGGVWFRPELLRTFARFSCPRHEVLAGPESLTLREREIVELIRRRLTNLEIAKALGIHECTVKFHLTNVFSKLNLSRRELFSDP